MNTKSMAVAVVVAGTFLTGANAVIAGGAHSSGHTNNSEIGKPGEAGHVDREINVEMGEMYFSTGDIDVRKGETIRFVVINKGEFVHEFNIGTAAMHGEHAQEMMAMMDSGMIEADRIDHAMMNQGEMTHKDPNSVLLEPGQSAEVIWTFSGDAKLETSCNVPGHRESGMLNSINVKPLDS